MNYGDVENVVIEWTCPDCYNDADEGGFNIYNSDTIMGKVIDKCETCNEEFQLN